MPNIIFKAARFVVAINGEQRCVAGFDGFAVLTAVFTHSRGFPGVPDESRSMIEGAVSFRVGGMQDGVSCNWFADEIVVGDEAAVRVNDGGPVGSTITVERTREAAMRRVEQRRQRMAKVDNAVPARLSVSVNGEHVCMAGVQSGVLSVGMSWVRRSPAGWPPSVEMTREQYDGGHTTLHVRGLDNDVHMLWTEGYLEIGDEVAVRVLGPGPIDEPKGRRSASSGPTPS